jgi:hypothetical protein
MARLMLVVSAALIALAALGFMGWQWLEPRLYGPLRSPTPEGIFLTINSERDFVEDVARRLLARDEVRTAMQIGAADSPPLDLASHSNLLIVLAVAQRIAHTDVLDDALLAASDDFMARYYDLGRREWRDEFVAAGPSDTATLRTVCRAMIALALAYDVTGNQRQMIAAQSIWDKHRSFVLPPDVLDASLPSRRPIDSATLVAVFDAMTVLYRVGGSSMLWTDIENLTRYMVRELMEQNDGVLAAAYTPSLEPVPGPPLPPAYQLIVATALAEAAEYGLSPLLVAPGSDLMDAVLKNRPPNATAHYTVADHTEAARAIAFYATRQERPDLWPLFEEHYNAMRRHLSAASPFDEMAQAARFYLAQYRLTGADGKHKDIQMLRDVDPDL